MKKELAAANESFAKQSDEMHAAAKAQSRKLQEFSDKEAEWTAEDKRLTDEIRRYRSDALCRCTSDALCPLAMLPEVGEISSLEFLLNKFCANFLCAICSVFLRICTGICQAVLFLICTTPDDSVNECML